MDPQVIKAIVVSGAIFGIFGVVPIVMALLQHQQKMAQLFAKGNLDTENLTQRLEVLERRLSALEPRPTADPKERVDLRRDSLTANKE
jgi:hypothetical protein